MSEETLMYVRFRENGECGVDVILGEGDSASEYTVTTDDNEPDDMWTPILQRALELALSEALLPTNRYVVGVRDVKSNHPDVGVFLVEHVENKEN